jgi:hypothetical protein
MGKAKSKKLASSQRGVAHKRRRCEVKAEDGMLSQSKDVVASQ